LTLSPNGTATVVLADGAANVEDWPATWAAAGDGIEDVIVLAGRDRHLLR